MNGRPLAGWRSLRLALVIALLAHSPQFAVADKVTLNDGRVIEGKFTRLSSMSAGSEATGGAGGLIVMADNDLNRTYFPNRWVKNVDPAPATEHLEEINLSQRVATTGMRIGGVGPIIEVTEFDEYGRRTFSMHGARGRIDVLQGITKITPVWCSVEGLQAGQIQSFVWNMRIATNSIPRETLSAILRKRIDPKNAEDRLKIVRIYLQGERYQDAEAELKQVLIDFPDRAAELKNTAYEIKQMGARRIVEEIETRRRAGQHHFAGALLQQFPAEGVSGQILQQVSAKLEEYTELNRQGEKILAQLSDLVAQIPASERSRIEPLVKEIRDELSDNTIDRMATFRRFADDESVSADRKLALAISGWLTGAGDATENLKVALALADLRTLLLSYLREDTKLRRDEIYSHIRAQEAVTPKLVAALLARMKPHRETPTQNDHGFYQLSVAGLPGEPDVDYYVQLPPEYDPYVNYPCIITLNGAGTTPEHQIDWWAGAVNTRGDRTVRNGQATRFGYIVIAPAWSAPHQKQFEGTAREHTAVLSTLRDACRRFSIDTDRVFLSGHSMGGDAAWEIGLSHPDLWAGVIPIVPRLDRMVQLYWKNAEQVPFYFVCGELDGDKMVKNASEFERYMNRTVAFDCTVVEYLGRGHEHFSDEILRLFDWMGRKQRNFFPRSMTAVTQRAWDNFFWWLELRDFQPPARPIEVSGNVTAANGLSIRAGGKIIVWLSPEIVDFTRPITVTLNGTHIAPPNSIQPDLAVLLEDVRTRGDRKHPFWAKVSNR